MSQSAHRPSVLILALDQRGQSFLFRANQKEFEQLDQHKFTDAETWAHIALVGDQIFIRELNALAALRWTRELEPNPKATQP